MKKITTINGTVYLLDEENKRVKRAPATSNHMIYDGDWVNYLIVCSLKNLGDSIPQPDSVADYPILVGEHLYLWYGSSKDMPWSLSTEIINIEEKEEK